MSLPTPDPNPNPNPKFNLIIHPRESQLEVNAQRLRNNMKDMLHVHALENLKRPEITDKYTLRDQF